MSEYQYYEFLAVDRPLTEREVGELREVSRRAEITPARFVNEYHFGNLRGDPRALLARYFDAMIYVANWGTHQLALKLPRELLPEATALAYKAGESLDVAAEGAFVLLDFYSQAEVPEGFEEGEEWAAALAPARAELLRGDLRALYLGWLLGAQRGELADDALEPEVPPGLRELSAPLSRLADFLRLDRDLIAAAASTSPAPAAPSAPPPGLAAWLKALPEREKGELLLAAALGRGAEVGARLLARFQAARRPKRPAARRAVAELLRAARGRAAERALERERRAEARARRAAQESQARAAHLDALSRRQAAAWQDAERLVSAKHPRAYDEAAALLRDLRDVAVRGAAFAEFEARLAQLLAKHAKKQALLARLRHVGLVA
jgi:hypothetical protein